MANTYVDYTGADGTGTDGKDFNFSFEYLRDEHVKVKVNGSEVTNFTIVTSPVQLIRFNTTPVADDTIKIYRDSRGDFSPLVDFVDGSILTENELDESYKHNLFIGQEASEGQGGEQLTKKGLIDYDAEGNKIINLGSPTTATDAATKSYVDQTIDNAELVGGSPATVSLGVYDVTSTNDTVKQLRAWTADIEDTNVTATGSSEARTLEDRFSDYINVLDYGVTGDGTTDDTAAIRTAISAGETANKTVYFPDGTYKVTEAIEVAFATRIEGESRLHTIIDVGASTLSYVLGRHGTTGYCSIKNLQIRNRGRTNVDALISFKAPTDQSGSAYYLQLENLLLAQNDLGGSRVSYLGNIYKCIETHTSSPSETPDTSLKWSLSTDVLSADDWVSGQDYTENGSGKCVEIYNNIYASLKTIKTAGGDYGIHANLLQTGLCQTIITSSHEVAGIYLEDSPTVVFDDCHTYSQDERSTTNHLMILDGCRSVAVRNSTFEPQTFSPVAACLLIDKNNSASESTYIKISKCRFLGFAASITNNIVLGATATVYNNVIEDCEMFDPGGTDVSILGTNQQNTSILNCSEISSYADTSYSPASSNNPAYTFYREQQSGFWTYGGTGAPNGTTIFGTSVGPYDDGTGRSIIKQASKGITANQIQAYYNGNGQVGSISTSGSGTSFNTSSDYRLKENVVPMQGAVNKLESIPVYHFNFKADPSKTVDGFLAHEVQAIISEAVTGDKDAVDEDGNPIYQGIDQSKLVPVLVGAVQELIQRVKVLEAK